MNYFCTVRDETDKAVKAPLHSTKPTNLHFYSTIEFDQVKMMQRPFISEMLGRVAPVSNLEFQIE